ncbi:protein SOB FIVE-LIKE 3 [Argentina anserina]|uniref:protein SOB FIVE-LIKE 3 n=1 Tax=Argentina anserina TaxID=57926 RepID=UPI0021765736|nr:protein SOB FIVE-LIKE 3 [Potentilla anserina]
MEFSHVVGAQKLSGSGESGWTMYLASPTHGERDGVDSSSYDTTKGNNASIEHQNDVDDGEESDDSMASDASSGPSHPDKSSHGATRQRRPKTEGNVKKHSTNKLKKTSKNESTIIKGEKAEEEILQHKADSAASRI